MPSVLTAPRPAPADTAPPGLSAHDDRACDALRAPTDAEWQAIAARVDGGDLRFGVATTGVYCRASCPARRPRRENVVVGAPSALRRAAFRACLRCTPDGPAPSAARDAAVDAARRYLDAQAASDAPLRLADLAAHVGIGAGTLQRAFTARVGVSPHAYRTARRMEAVGAALGDGETVAAAALGAGFGSPRAVHDRADAAFGMSAGARRRGGAGETVVYGLAACALGRVLAAHTARGLSALAFGDDDTALADALARDLPRATITRDDRALAGVFAAIHTALGGASGPAPGDDAALHAIPLDLDGTAFQHRVWAALRAIPRGETRTYGDLAAEIGHPSAVRALAQACAANRVGLAVPCHRVVPAGGGGRTVGGYRWGPARKARLLAIESGGDG